MRVQPNIFWFLWVMMIPACRDRADPVASKFALKRGDIQKIELRSQLFGLQSFQYKEGRWYLHDSLLVRPDAIDNIFKVLTGVQIHYEPPRAAWSMISETIQREGLAIRVYDGQNHLLTSYALGGSTNDERGTYAQMAQVASPVVIRVPGFEGNLATRFLMDAAEWRDRMIIDLNQEDLYSIRITYPSEMFNSFELQKQGTGWIVRNAVGLQLPSYPAIINDYLNKLEKIGAESIENRFEQKEAVLASTPHAIMEIKMARSPHVTRTIKAYSNLLNGQLDTERLFIYDGKDFYLAQWRILFPIFRPLEYFSTREPEHKH
jgi:hypothetical protein